MRKERVLYDEDVKRSNGGFKADEFQRSWSRIPQKPLQRDPLGPAVGFKGASGGLVPCSVSQGLGVALGRQTGGLLLVHSAQHPTNYLGDGGEQTVTSIRYGPHRSTNSGVRFECFECCAVYLLHVPSASFRYFALIVFFLCEGTLSIPAP